MELVLFITLCHSEQTKCAEESQKQIIICKHPHLKHLTLFLCYGNMHFVELEVWCLAPILIGNNLFAGLGK